MPRTGLIRAQIVNKLAQLSGEAVPPRHRVQVRPAGRAPVTGCALVRGERTSDFLVRRPELVLQVEQRLVCQGHLIASSRLMSGMA